MIVFITDESAEYFINWKINCLVCEMLQNGEKMPITISSPVSNVFVLQRYSVYNDIKQRKETNKINFHQTDDFFSTITNIELNVPLSFHIYSFKLTCEWTVNVHKQ